MITGIERAPVYPATPIEPMTERQLESLNAFQSIEEHRELVAHTFGLESDQPYRLTKLDLEARDRQQEFARNVCYTTSRTTVELGKFVLATVKQMEDEFRKKTVLDIGSGVGRFGEAIARNAKAEVTFLDRDPEALEKVSKRAGRIVLADGLDLPFEEESFERVMASFSSVHWASNPEESAKALNEIIRVTQKGGGMIIIPIINNISERRNLLPVITAERLPNGDFHPQDRYAVVWALQDLVVTDTLFRLAEEGIVNITWSNTLTPTQLKGVNLENFSVVVDKLDSIPEEILAENLSYARQFMPQER